MCDMPKGRGAVSTGLPTPQSSPRTLSTLHHSRRINPAHSIVSVATFSFGLSPSLALWNKMNEPDFS
jgi:hypothetical protein